MDIFKKINTINNIVENTMLKLKVVLLKDKAQSLVELGKALTNTGCDDYTEGGFWLWNYNNNEVYYSPKFCNILGYEYDELGHGFGGFNRGNPIQIAYGMKVIDNLIKEHNTDHFVNTISFTKKDNTIINIECSGAVFFIDKKPYIILGTHKIKS